jgi:predicted amidohydrolase
VPELAFTGYVSPRADFDLRPFAEPIDGPTIAAASQSCRRRGIHLAAPLPLAEGGRVYNAMIVIAPDGAVLATYKKKHPWFPERWATPGAEAAPLVSIGGLSVALAICFDGHFLAEEAAATLSRADLLVFTSAWVDEDDTRMGLLEDLARQFELPIANANWGPGVVVVPGQGGSCILDRAGRAVAAVTPGRRRADANIAPRS